MSSQMSLLKKSEKKIRKPRSFKFKMRQNKYILAMVYFRQMEIATGQKVSRRMHAKHNLRSYWRNYYRLMFTIVARRFRQLKRDAENAKALKGEKKDEEYRRLTAKTTQTIELLRRLQKEQKKTDALAARRLETGPSVKTDLLAEYSKAA